MFLEKGEWELDGYGNLFSSKDKLSYVFYHIYSFDQKKALSLLKKIKKKYNIKKIFFNKRFNEYDEDYLKYLLGSENSTHVDFSKFKQSGLYEKNIEDIIKFISKYGNTINVDYMG